jgi:hypothetical protein
MLLLMPFLASPTITFLVSQFPNAHLLGCKMFFLKRKAKDLSFQYIRRDKKLNKQTQPEKLTIMI